MPGPGVSSLPTSASSHPLDFVSIVTNLKIKLDIGQKCKYWTDSTEHIYWYLCYILFWGFLSRARTHFGQEVIVFLVADLVFRLSAEGAIVVMANVGLMWRGSNSLKLKSGIINAST